MYISKDLKLEYFINRDPMCAKNSFFEQCSMLLTVQFLTVFHVVHTSDTVTTWVVH